MDLWPPREGGAIRREEGGNKGEGKIKGERVPLHPPPHPPHFPAHIPFHIPSSHTHFPSYNPIHPPPTHQPPAPPPPQRPDIPSSTVSGFKLSHMCESGATELEKEQLSARGWGGGGNTAVYMTFSWDSLHISSPPTPTDVITRGTLLKNIKYQLCEYD